MTVPKPERFLKFPVECSMLWETRSLYERNLGKALYFEFQERKVQMGADWTGAICGRLRANGRERPPLHNALKELEKAGLVVVASGTFELIYTERTSTPQPPHDASASTPRPAHDGGTSTARPNHTPTTTAPQPGLSARNSSDPSGEIDREKQEKDTQTETGVRARVEFIELDEETQARFARAVEARFQSLFSERFEGTEPGMGGKNTAAFPRRLWDTARKREVNALELLDHAFASWCAKGCDGMANSTAYAAFIARFEQSVGPRSARLACAAPGAFEGGDDLASIMESAE